MTAVNPDTVRATLDESRARLVAQLDELGADESGELRPDMEFTDGFADAASATAERTERLGLVESLMTQLHDVDRALGRLAEGAYGTCHQCGKPIPAARLEARPESTLCVECKSGRR